MLARKLLINSRRQMSTHVQYMTNKMKNECINTDFTVIEKPMVGEFVMIDQIIFSIRTPTHKVKILSEYEGIVTKVYDLNRIQFNNNFILYDIFGRIPMCDINDNGIGMDAVCLWIDKLTRKPVAKTSFT